MTDASGFLQCADGIRIAYKQQFSANKRPKDSPGIVFLCGFRSDMDGIKAQALGTWCSDFDCDFIRFDYFAHGRTGGAFRDATLGRWLADTVLVIDRLTSGPQVLVGSSMGGWLMLLAALARPRRISGLVGIACATDFSEDLIRAQLDPTQLAELNSNGAFERRSDYADEPHLITQKLLDEGRQHLLLRSQIALDVPLRLMHGVVDEDVPYSVSMKVLEQYRGSDARLVLIKDGEHRLSRASDLACLRGLISELL